MSGDGDLRLLAQRISECIPTSMVHMQRRQESRKARSAVELPVVALAKREVMILGLGKGKQ